MPYSKLLRSFISLGCKLMYLHVHTVYFCPQKCAQLKHIFYSLKSDIAENFRGRKLSCFGTKRKFLGENFCRLVQSNYYVGLARVLGHAQRTRMHATCALQFLSPHPKYSRRKLSRMGLKPRKTRKFSDIRLHSVTMQRLW